MQAKVTDHIWSLEEFLDALLAAEDGEKPKAKPLAHREPEGPARELPNGRGFLRLVGGKASPAPAPIAPPPTPTPVAPQAIATGQEEPSGQLDLLSWRPPPPKKGQLSLFEF